MKIMIVTPYYSPAVGGLENYARNIAKGLVAEGNDVFVVTANHIDKTRREDTVDDIRVIRLPIQFKLSNTPFHFGWKRMFRDIITNEKPDVINAHTPVPYISDMASRAAGNVPVVLTYHNDLVKPSGVGKYLAKLFYVLYMNKTMRQARRIITTSQYYADTSLYLAKYKTKLDIVSPGVDLARYNTKVDKKWLRKQYPGKKIILFVASMKRSHAHKGLPVLLEACAKLDTKSVDYQLVAVGAGDGIADYEARARELGIADRVTFTGFVEDDDLPKYYAGAHVLALPSTTEAEGFGMVLVEAQACGTPVIGSRVGGIPYAVGDEKTGVLVPKRDVHALARTLTQVLTNAKKSADLSKHGAQRALRNFGWQSLAVTTRDAFHDAARPHIVHVTSYYPPHLGGMEKVVYELAHAQKSMGKHVRVITSKPKHGTANDSSIDVVELSCFEVAHTPVMPKLHSALLSLSSRDILHVHIAQAYVPEIVYLASRIRHFKYVAEIHLDVAPSGPMGILLKPYKKVFLKKVLCNAHAVIVFTEDQKKSAIENYGLDPKRVQIVPNGVGEEYFENNNRALHHPIRLLFVGRLNPQKNLSQLLEALSGASNKFDLHVVGDGPMRSQWEKLSESLNLQNVSFLGQKQGNDLLHEYRWADVFVLPSEREGMPLVLLEAMAMGLPIVATNVIGNRDIVSGSRNGYLVEYGSPQAIAEALLKLNAESYKKLSQGSQDFIQNYTWKNIAKKIEALYE